MLTHSNLTKKKAIVEDLRNDKLVKISGHQKCQIFEVYSVLTECALHIWVDFSNLT